MLWLMWQSTMSLDYYTHILRTIVVLVKVITFPNGSFPSIGRPGCLTKATLHWCLHYDNVALRWTPDYHNNSEDTHPGNEAPLSVRFGRGHGIMLPPIATIIVWNNSVCPQEHCVWLEKMVLSAESDELLLTVRVLPRPVLWMCQTFRHLLFCVRQRLRPSSLVIPRLDVKHRPTVL